MQAEATIAVLIICGNRFQELVTGLKSLELIDSLITEIHVLKNAPTVDWSAESLEQLPASVRAKLKITSSDRMLFPTEGRNILAAKANAGLFLFLDDDSYLLESSGIEKGCEILMRDKSIGSIAYPQCDNHGDFSQNGGQPAPVNYACFTCGFMTCGALVRGDVYRELNGFQEILGMAHEENEFCRRQWDAGYAVVYLPESTVCHMPSPVARNMRQRALLNTRNAWFQAVLHEPWWLLMASLPARFVFGALYLRGAGDWIGGDWKPVFCDAVKQFVKHIPALFKRRNPLKLKTIRRWQEIKKAYPRFELHPQ
jgi:GT2 family glycosyltransferase